MPSYAPPLPTRDAPGHILITLCQPRPGFPPNTEYPLAVVYVHPDGYRGQETNNRSVREARIFANGMAAGMLLINGASPPVQLDPILKDVT